MAAGVVVGLIAGGYIFSLNQKINALESELVSQQEQAGNVDEKIARIEKEHEKEIAGLKEENKKIRIEHELIAGQRSDLESGAWTTSQDAGGGESCSTVSDRIPA